jgi:ATPase family protein associated with various cellular activities (AAA)
MPEPEDKAYFYEDRIEQIDSLLEGPVHTLIRLATVMHPKEKRLRFPTKKVLYFPPWISEGVLPKESEHVMTWSLCSATLQRIWRMRRRFPWLEKYLDLLAPLEKETSATFTPINPSSFDHCFKLLKSHAFGGLNPITASQVFRVFLNSSEAEAHSGVGFLAFFAMLWALRRRFPDSLNIGAAIRPWEPSTYVTANCLLPIKTLQGICRRRAEVLKEIREYLTELWKPANDYDESQQGKYSGMLDKLTSRLLQLSEISIDRGKSLREYAAIIEQESANITVYQDNQKIYERVLVQCTKRIVSLGEQEVPVLTGADLVLKGIEDRIIGNLNSQFYRNLRRLDLRFAEEYVTGTHADRYWADLKTSAEESLDVCKRALNSLRSAAEACEATSKRPDDQSIQNVVSGKDEDTFRDILKSLDQLSQANKDVARMMEEPVAEAAHWCRSVVDRQISYVTAGNLTDFDPSELVSGIAVAVRWNLMPSWLEVSNAIKRALDGARLDGSWSPGQPFYSPDNSTAISTRTSDIVWTLTSAIEVHPSINAADNALFEYVNWLQRTLIEVVGSGEGAERARYVGWASDRLRHPRKIQLATTALSINALLEIRDLTEYRLWELCKKRFSFVPATKKLRDVKATDLGAKHDKRLHGQIARMGRRAQGPDYKDAEYSLVLHGPPGSSKTMVAQALSAEMWKTSSRWGRQEPRLIRITPGDFTRTGEARVDAEARLIFDLLSRVRGVTIFFDEIDDLLRRRNPSATSLGFLDLVVPAMLNRLADLRDFCPKQELCFLLATNFVEKMEPALIRKGRIDRPIPVVYPDFQSRLAILREEECKDAERIAAAMAGWPYLEILSICKKIKTTADQSDKLVEQILERGALTPSYDDRLKVPSPELVNEYLHCKIAEASDESLDTCKRGVPERWHNTLDEIWREEGRPIPDQDAGSGVDYNRRPSTLTSDL